MLDNKIEKIIDTVTKMNNSSSDITSRILNIKNKKIGYIFLDSTASDDKIGNIILENIKKNEIHFYTNIYNYLKNNIKGAKTKEVTTYDDLFYHLASGFICILVNNTRKAFLVETKANLDRSITDSTTESIIRGAKDSFNENYNTNIGLIRKRLKTDSLHIKELTLGAKTKTKVSIMYLEDMVDKELLEETITKIESIKSDKILDTYYIKSLIANENK